MFVQPALKPEMVLPGNFFLNCKPKNSILHWVKMMNTYAYKIFHQILYNRGFI